VDETLINVESTRAVHYVCDGCGAISGVVT
jgi:hypothetical protein